MDDDWSEFTMGEMAARQKSLGQTASVHSSRSLSSNAFTEPPLTEPVQSSENDIVFPKDHSATIGAMPVATHNSMLASPTISNTASPPGVTSAQLNYSHEAIGLVNKSGLIETDLVGREASTGNLMESTQLLTTSEQFTQMAGQLDAIEASARLMAGNNSVSGDIFPSSERGEENDKSLILAEELSSSMSRPLSVRRRAFGRPPDIQVRLPSNVELESGSRLVLTVSATGVPRPYARWLRDGASLECAVVDPDEDDENGNSGLPRVRVTCAGDEYELVVESVSSADSGAYKVVLENVHGAAIATCCVTVLSAKTASANCVIVL